MYILIFVSARDLHEKLGIGTRFNDWFPRMCEYGFVENEDFYSKMSKTENVKNAEIEPVVHYGQLWITEPQLSKNTMRRLFSVV